MAGLMAGAMPPRGARSAAMRVWMLMGSCGSSSKNSGSLVGFAAAGAALLHLENAEGSGSQQNTQMLEHDWT